MNRQRALVVLSLSFLLHAGAGEARAATGYAAVWRPGSGAQWVHAGLSWSQFKTQDKTYFDQGLRLEDIEVASGKYTAVWRPGSGAQWVHPGLTWSQFKAQDKAYFDKGLRLKDLEVAGGEYTAVWRPGTGAQWVHPGLSWSEFKTQDKAYFDKGLRLADLELVGGEYTAVWRPGTGAQWVHPGLSWSQFRTQDKAYFGQGLRLADLETAGGKYTGVWQPGSGAQWVWPGLCFSDFKTEDTTYFKQGLRLVTVEVHSAGRAIYRLPFDDDDGWELWNANWDDGGHGGKKDGLQAYAFDFVHDADDNNVGEGGQNVRAARGGTVHTFLESESKNSAGSKDLCKDGVGNYLVIRHDDGTFGTYWHLAKNGVLVALGQKVERGDVIATSGNTGTSSTPHLHFDVRTGWNSAYSKCNLDGTELPSVRIMFEDQNHACWIPKSGDELASNNE